MHLRIEKAQAKKKENHMISLKKFRAIFFSYSFFMMPFDSYFIFFVLMFWSNS